MRLQGAFHVPDHPKNGLLRIHPSSKRLAPFVTGGLKLLYKNIDNRVVPERHGLGAFTDDKGRFRPQKGMPPLAKRYRFVEVIGKGQSSISIKAADTYCDNKLVAVKVLHQHNYTLGFQESDCIRRLNTADPFCLSPTFRMHTTFCFDGHYCMVFELLRPEPLHSYFKHVEYQQKLNRIRQVTVQLLKALGFLQQQNVLHADLKPENILLSKEDDLGSLKVVDFGNAIHCVHAELSLYYDDFELQTLLYRAPEVMFGQPFGLEADMWSLGCILAELYHGQSLFFAKDKIGVLQKIVEVLGPLPETVFQRGKFFSQFKHFTTRTLSPKNSTNAMMNLLRCTDYAFCNFLVRLLAYNPAERLTVAEAACHPFLAPIAGVAYFLPKGSYRGYPQVFLDQKDFAGQPTVAPEIERMALDPISLLKRGTHTTTPPSTKQIAQVTPIQQHTSASKSSRNAKGHKASKSITQGRAFVFEQNNNQVYASQNFPQPRITHSNNGSSSLRRDVEPIDLTQSSPNPVHNDRNLPRVGISPKPNVRSFEQQSLADERMNYMQQDTQACRKRSRTEVESSRQANRPASQKRAQSGTTSSLYQGGDRLNQQANKPVNEMFKTWENSMSKYIDKSQGQPKWSASAGDVASAAIRRSLGLAPSSSTGQQNQPNPLKSQSANKRMERCSYALQPNRIAKVASKEAKPSDGLNVPQNQAKRRSSTVSRSDSANSGSEVNKTATKRSLSTDLRKQGSDESNRTNFARERYCPQFSDISNSQSVDENMSPREMPDRTMHTDFTSYLGNHGNFKRSESDINANSLHYCNNTELTQAGLNSVSDGSDSSVSGDNASFVPPKKRKRYRKTSGNNSNHEVHYKQSNPSGQSVIVNGKADIEEKNSKKMELKKALLQEKAAIEKKLSKISQRKGAVTSDSGMNSNGHRQHMTDDSVYDFEPEVSHSPIIHVRASAMQSRVEQNGVRKLFGNRTPTNSNAMAMKNPGSNGNAIKKSNPKANMQNDTTACRNNVAIGRNTEVQPSRRTSPRKHASTARLTGSCDDYSWHNGVKSEGWDDSSDTSADESDVLQMTVYSPNGSRNSSPLSNEDEVMLMPT